MFYMVNYGCVVNSTNLSTSISSMPTFAPLCQISRLPAGVRHTFLSILEIIGQVQLTPSELVHSWAYKS